MTILTKSEYNPSVNIIRDNKRNLDYILTPNAKLSYDSIEKHYIQGTHSFSLIGAYGTGKSSFLLALRDQIRNQKSIFVKSHRLGKKKYEIIPIVGKSTSIVETFADIFGVKQNKNIKTSRIIDKISEDYEIINKKNKGLAIFIDEFGKFLEFAAKNNPEFELYFMQELAELANDNSKDILLITTLHQGFNSYARELSKPQQQEWDKVKGRFIELTFNEPVEQLLLLAARKLALIPKDIPSNFLKLFSIIKESNAFPLKDYFNSEISKDLYPFDILAASVTTLALQKYGQNQRSLFSFIESKSHLSIGDYDHNNNPYYNLACVYDYLIFNHFSLLSTKYNPDYSQWASIKSSLERVDAFYTKGLADYQKAVKTIGLLNIFASSGANLDKDFLTGYFKHSLGIEKSAEIIESLEANRIIKYSPYNKRYKLTDGTDLNIEIAIDQAGNIVQQISNISDQLKNYFEFPFILAKEAFYTTGTPRFFGYILSDEPITQTPEGEVDGFINLIFSEDFEQKEIKSFSSRCEEPIIFGLYGNSSEIKKLLFEISKIKKVIEINKEDHFALKELDAIIEHQKNLLNHYILNSFYGSDYIAWYFKGKKIAFQNQKLHNKFLSKVCKDIYFKTPIFKNELVNRSKISSAVIVARKNLLNKLIHNVSEKDLDFDNNKFPPEKSIYLSLLKNTGIHRAKNGKYNLYEPTDISFQDLWSAGIDFIDNTKDGKRPVSELKEIFLSSPFKLKQGFIDFWLPIFFYANKDRFALYEDDTFIPNYSADTLELITKRPNDYDIKAFNFDEKRLRLFNQYREFLNQVEERQPTNDTFIETVKPFIVFYSNLSFYNANTNKISKNAKAFRKAIENATDPEKIFFEDIPKALGYSLKQLLSDSKNIESFILTLRSCIQEINSAYDDLLNRIESYITKKIIGQQLNFPEYKTKLIDRFKKINMNTLSAKQKAILQRIKSPLQERKSWLNSIAFVIIGKSLEDINDSEEIVFYEKFSGYIYELDNLCDLSKVDFDEKNEEVYKIEITSFVRGLEKKLVRMPKQNKTKISKLAENLNKELKSNDRDLNIALLTSLLREQLKNGK